MDTKHYLYRSSTDKLAGHLDHIEESGDRVLGVAYMGENRWHIVCRKGAPPSVAIGYAQHDAAAGELVEVTL